MKFELTEKQISKAEVDGVASYYEHTKIHTDTGEYFAGRSGIAFEAQKELVKWLIETKAEVLFTYLKDELVWETLVKEALNHFGVKDEEDNKDRNI